MKKTDTLLYMIDSTTIGQTIATLREERGISQAELRRTTGVNVWRLENGWFKPNLSTLEKVAIALDIPVTELLR